MNKLTVCIFKLTVVISKLTVTGYSFIHKSEGFAVTKARKEESLVINSYRS